MAEKSKEIVIVDDKIIKDKIYLIRGQKVMLDADLAEIYGYETKNFNRQVKNNIEKFEGEDFMFQLTENEFENLRCKNFTSSWGGAIDYGTENEAFYLCGASSKDAGNKISSITKIEESSKDMYHVMFGGMLNNKNLKI